MDDALVEKLESSLKELLGDSEINLYARESRVLQSVLKKNPSSAATPIGSLTTTAHLAKELPTAWRCLAVWGITHKGG